MSARALPQSVVYSLIALLALAVAGAAGYFLGKTPDGSTSEREQGEQGAAKEPDEKTVEPVNNDLLSQAFEASFGTEGKAVVIAGENSEATTFTPGKLVSTSFGPVLLSEGHVENFGHVSSGKMAVFYLRQTSSGFAVQKKFIPAVEAGSMGSLAEWSVSSKFSSFPVVAIEGGGTWQGYTCSSATLLELLPTKPTELVTIPTYYGDEGSITDDSKPTSVEGKIGNIVQDKSFDVIYTGTMNFRERYVRRGDKYTLASGRATRMQTC